MGSGKTQSAITKMNEDTEYKYIFITPFLTEVDRIKLDCADRHFISPVNKGDGKLDNLHYLLGNKENIASTHALFRAYDDYTIELIKNGNYKLILDEVFGVVERIEIKNSDLKILFDSKCIEVNENTNKVKWLKKEYDGKFWEIKMIAETGNLILYKDVFLYWVFPVEVFHAFKEITILTYLFDSQIQKYYYDMNNIEYEKIYTKNISGYTYKFSNEYYEYPYIKKIKDKIHILEDEKLNMIGESETALSSSWYNREKDKKRKPLIRTLKNNLTNVFTNKYKVPLEYKMWTTFKDHKELIGNKGYKTAFIACNLRAKNDFRDRTHLAYCINVYFNPHLKNYFLDHGVMVKEEEYALSELVQWIWRSAIRDGKEIWLYLPSSRMRNLLKNWMDIL